MSSIAVFAGPTIQVDDILSELQCDVRAPIKRGDLEALSPNTRLVLIIDGEFRQSLSVSPKEILSLLNRGITVLGAASMGALRAAELAEYGMIGVGWIFEQYHSGTIRDDSEVALLYRSDDYVHITVPMVNVRYWLSSFAQRGLIEDALLKELLERISNVHYEDRRVKTIFQIIMEIVASEDVATLLMSNPITDVKRNDAISALLICKGMLKRTL